MGSSDGGEGGVDIDQRGFLEQPGRTVRAGRAMRSCLQAPHGVQVSTSHHAGTQGLPTYLRTSSQTKVSRSLGARLSAICWVHCCHGADNRCWELLFKSELLAMATSSSSVTRTKSE